MTREMKDEMKNVDDFRGELMTQVRDVVVNHHRRGLMAAFRITDWVDQDQRALLAVILGMMRDLPYDLRRVMYDNLPENPGPNECNVAWKAVIDRILQPTDGE